MSIGNNRRRSGGAFPMWFRYVHPRERKNYGIMEDFQTPSLQFLGAFVVWGVSLLLAASWLMLSPPLIPWLAGMAFAIVAPPLFFFRLSEPIIRWLVMPRYERLVEIYNGVSDLTSKVNILKKRARESGLNRDTMSVEAAMKELAWRRSDAQLGEDDLRRYASKMAILHLLSTAAMATIAMLVSWHVVWDWWERITYGFCGIPKIQIDGLTVWLPLGIALAILGFIFTLYKPSRYTFGLQVTGYVTMIVTWWFRPVTIQWTRGGVTGLTRWDAIFYMAYACICVSVWLAARSYLIRMHKEMEDEFPFEWGDMNEQEPPVEHHFVRGPYSHRFPPPQAVTTEPEFAEPVIQTHDGTQSVLVKVRDFVEVLRHMAVHDMSKDNVISPKWHTSGGTLISQYNHWRSYLWPLEQAGIYDRETRTLDPKFEPLDVEQVLKELGLDGST